MELAKDFVILFMFILHNFRKHEHSVDVFVYTADNEIILHQQTMHVT